MIIVSVPEDLTVLDLVSAAAGLFDEVLLAEGTLTVESLDATSDVETVACCLDTLKETGMVDLSTWGETADIIYASLLELGLVLSDEVPSDGAEVMVCIPEIDVLRVAEELEDFDVLEIDDSNEDDGVDNEML